MKCPHCDSEDMEAGYGYAYEGAGLGTYWICANPWCSKHLSFETDVEGMGVVEAAAAVMHDFDDRVPA